MKKTLSIILTILMIVTTVPMAFAVTEDLTDPTTSITLKDTDYDSFYEIATADELKAFANLVNAGNVDINAELTADIVLNENVVNEEGQLNGDGSSFESWTPIGNADVSYTGFFDGANHAISGLYYSGKGEYAGLFASVRGKYGDKSKGTIRNLYLVDSYFDVETDEMWVRLGGLAGFSYYGYFSNCYVEAQFDILNTYAKGSRIAVAGISALTYSSAENCFTNIDVDITQKDYYSTTLDEGGILGSVAGWSEIINCHTNYNTLTEGHSSMVLENSTASRTDEEFENGTICSLVGYHPYVNGVCDACGYECPHENWTDGVCDVCGVECPHEETYYDIIRPVQNADGTWGKGTAQLICVVCGPLTPVEEVERNHEGYKLFDETAAKLELLLGRDDIIPTPKESMSNSLRGNRNAAYSRVYTDLDFEKEMLASMTKNVNDMLVELEARIADGMYIKADFSYLVSLLNEINALVDNNPENIISSFSVIYADAVNFYKNNSNNPGYNQNAYDYYVNSFDLENQLEKLIAGLKDGSALKADYTVIDEAIAEIEEKLGDVELTDEAKAGLEEIKAELEEMKADGNTSAADLAELEKAFDEYETELDAGIEDGSAVKVDGLKEIVNINDKLNNELAEKYGEEALAEIAEKFDEKFADKFDELYERAEALTGSVAENKDALDKIEAEMEAIFAEAENCLNGTHNGLKFEVTEDAECGKNAVESAVCTLCGETVTREVEDSALTHSFTKYEVTEEAKCGIEGKKVAVCDHGCGETDEKAIEALEHLFIDYIYNEDATCTADGTKTAECIYGCGETDTVTAEDTMFDHADEDGDGICDDCETEIKDVCPDCGGPAHEETGVPQYICMLVTLVKLLIPLIRYVYGLYKI